MIMAAGGGYRGLCPTCRSAIGGHIPTGWAWPVSELARAALVSAAPATGPE